jgi:hypothetical protein
VALTRRQRDAFEQREGEDAYEFLARTMRTLRARDLVRVYMMRHDDVTQVDGIRLWVDLRMAFWTRALAFGTVVLGVCTIVAALIARS